MTIPSLIDWFRTTPEIPGWVFQHLYLSFIPVLVAALLMVPMGLVVGHYRRFEGVAVAIANLGRAIPSFAILALFLPISIRLGLGLGAPSAFAALFFLSLPPILINAYIGVRNVDQDVVESAHGMGMGDGQVLRRVELPLAAPLIVAGIRTAAVQAVATATLAALVAGGGLGDPIILGFRASRHEALLGGAILVAALAMGTELGLSLVQRASERGASSGGRPPRGAIHEAAEWPRAGDPTIL